MSDVRQLLTDYEGSYTGCDGECTHDCNDDRGRLAPKAFAAVRAVLDAHKPHQFFSDEPMVCVGCTWDPDDTETHVAYPCTTVRAITTALEAK